MVTRTELFSYHNVFSVELDGKTYHAYCLPYYETVYIGRNVFPDGEHVYLIPGGEYAKLVTMKHRTPDRIAEYVEHHIDDPIMQDSKLPDGFIYLGERRDFLGSQSSAVMQAVIQYMSSISDKSTLKGGDDDVRAEVDE